METPSVTDLLNNPVVFRIAGKDYPIKRLSIGEILGLAEAEVRKQAMSDANEMAKSLSGKEKVDFLRGILQDLPKGENLRKACDDYLNTPAGVSGIFSAAARKADPSYKADMLASMMDESSLGELALAVRHAIGGGESEALPANDSPEKKTSGPVG